MSSSGHHHLSKTDSEVSSLTPSSPGRSSPPRSTAYYVQSPSRDSHDDDGTTTGKNTTNSFHSTPVIISPMGSPPHSQHSNSSLGPHSRESSSTRFSGSHHRNNNKNDNNHHRRDGDEDGRKGRRRGGGGNNKPWKGFDAIEEEGLLFDGDGSAHGLSARRCYFLAFVVGFALLFTVFSLILWGASKPQKPTVAMKSITFDQFIVQAGADFSGVATEMVSINCSVKLTFRNTATFFGVHVTPTPLDLSYSQLTIATGTVKEFYQSRKSQRTLTATARGNKIPLYGGGAELGSFLKGAPVQPVPLALSLMVRSRANVLGRLVRPKFYKRIRCVVVMDPRKMNLAIPLKNKCTYQ
ncbi:unnamed protein product [Linum trigynum]|uniref:Late embryogenesis abundant protein LEA-2 subgroup domain-containing protein n=1 Tax=Linum trigynum TaxID=586398 RepID=A0AAV2E4E8_9ROSI